jgi:hypothetical protein
MGCPLILAGPTRSPPHFPFASCPPFVSLASAPSILLLMRHSACLLRLEARAQCATTGTLHAALLMRLADASPWLVRHQL